MNSSLLLIISAAFHALWNLALKRSAHRVGAALAFMTVATVLNAAYFAFTAISPDINVELIGGVLFAGVCEGVYFYLLTTAYAKQSLGVAYTIMRGGAMVLVWLISTLAMNEAITTLDAISIGTIILGIAFVTRSFSWRDLITSGAYAAYICAVCIAGYHIGYGVAVRTGASPALVFSASMACGVITYLACDRGRSIPDLQAALLGERVLLIAGGVMCGLSFLLFVTALTLVEPGRAISLRNTSVAFGAVLSFALGERLLAVQWVGVLLVVAGAVLLI